MKGSSRSIKQPTCRKEGYQMLEQRDLDDNQRRSSQQQLDGYHQKKQQPEDGEKSQCNEDKEAGSCCLAVLNDNESLASGCIANCETILDIITTKLRVQNICCGQEVKILRSTLEPLNGFVSLSVNIPSRIAVVRHKTCILPKAEIVRLLNEKHLGVSVIEQGHSSRDEDTHSIFLSKFAIQLGCITVTFLLYMVTLFASIYKTHWMKWVACAMMIFGSFFVLTKVILNCRKKVFLDINLLVLIAVVGIACLGDWLEGATVIFVFQVAGILQEFCLYKVQKVLSELVIRSPNKAVIAKTKEVVEIESIDVGTILLSCGGDIIPLDGVVVAGNGNVDESSITGESIPVSKKIGDVVYSGTILQTGFLEIKTTSTSEDSTLSQISDMVLEAQGEASHSELIVNKFAKIYTPVVLVTALLVFVVPLMLSAFEVFEYSSQLLSTWGRRSLILLLIACPCALIMSVPMPIFCSINAAARNGLLIKGSMHMEILAAVKTVAFDKTGTLTEGKFQVVNVKVLSEKFSERDIMRMVAGVESKSVHPIAAALVSHHLGCLFELHQSDTDIKTLLPEVTHLQTLEGLGVTGKIENHEIAIGNLELMDVLDIGSSMVEGFLREWSRVGHTVVLVAVDLQISMIIGLADQPRESAYDCIKALEKLDIETVILTGDSEGAANGISKAVGIAKFYSGMKPKDKVEWIKATQASQKGKVVMIGDGINDVPSLAVADVGIAVSSSGAGMVLNSAHAVLMSDNLVKIAALLSLSKHTRKICIQNILLALLFKLVVLIALLFSFMSLWMVILADLLSLIVVIANGFRPFIWNGANDSWQ